MCGYELIAIVAGMVRLTPNVIIAATMAMDSDPDITVQAKEVDGRGSSYVLGG